MCQVGNYPFEDPVDPGSFSKTIQVGWVLAPAHDLFHSESSFSKTVQVGRQSWLCKRMSWRQTRTQAVPR